MQPSLPLDLTYAQPQLPATIPMAYRIQGDSTKPTIYVIGTLHGVFEGMPLSGYETARLKIFADYIIKQVSPMLAIAETTTSYANIFPCNSSEYYLADQLIKNNVPILGLETMHYQHYLVKAPRIPVIIIGTIHIYYPFYQHLMQDYPRVALALSFALCVARTLMINICGAYILSYNFCKKDTTPSWTSAILWYLGCHFIQILVTSIGSTWTTQSDNALALDKKNYNFDFMTSFFLTQKIPAVPAIHAHLEEKYTAITTRNQRWASRLAQLMKTGSMELPEGWAIQRLFKKVTSIAENRIAPILDHYAGYSESFYAADSRFAPIFPAKHHEIVQHLQETCDAPLESSLSSQGPGNILVFVGVRHLEGLPKEVAQHGLHMEPIELIPQSFLDSLTDTVRAHKNEVAQHGLHMESIEQTPQSFLDSLTDTVRAHKRNAAAS